jgi:hypothetical protein
LQQHHKPEDAFRHLFGYPDPFRVSSQFWQALQGRGVAL